MLTLPINLKEAHLRATKKIVSLFLALLMALGLCVTAGAEEGATITVGFWGSSGEDKAIDAALEGVLEAIPGVKEVKKVQYPSANDFYEKLPGQFVAGTAPDVVVATNERHLQLIDNGVLAPLDSYGFDLTGYAENAVQAWNYEGVQYGIPMTAAPALFAINVDLWNAAGLGDYPTTMEEVYEAAKTLTKDGVVGLCIHDGSLFATTQYLNAFGGGWNGTHDIDRQENIDGLDFVFKMFDEGVAAAPRTLGLGWDGEVFAAGKAAMTTAGTWYVNLMRESAPDTNYVFIPFPGGNGKTGCTLHSYGAAVIADGENEDLAAQVAYYMARQESQEKRAELMGDRPCMEAALPVFQAANPALAVIDEYIAEAKGFNYPGDQAFTTDLVNALQAHIHAGDTTSAADVLKTLAATYGK